MVDVSAVIVSYNSRDYLGPCLRALGQSSDGPRVETFVVDNNSSDGSADYAEAAYPDVRLIRNSVNRGFAAANNQAIARAVGRYVLLLNPDAFVEPGALRRLVDYMDGVDCRSVGAVGPRLLNIDGTLQCSIGVFPTAMNQLGANTSIARMLPGVRWLSELDKRPHSYKNSHEVDWLFGAVLLMRREAIEAVGLLDESFFVFGEEKDWCMRARQAGWSTHFVSDATAVHVGRQGPGSAASYRFWARSKLLFVQKHHGTWACRSVRLLMALRMSCLSAISARPGARRSREKASKLDSPYRAALGEVMRFDCKSRSSLDLESGR